MWFVCLCEREKFTWNDTIFVFQFRKVVKKHYLGEMEKYSIFWLLTFSVIFLPNIMEIRQCFHEL